MGNRRALGEMRAALGIIVLTAYVVASGGPTEHQPEQMPAYAYPEWKSHGLATFYQQVKCTGDVGVQLHPFYNNDDCDRSCNSANGARSAFVMMWPRTTLKAYPTGDCTGDEIPYDLGPFDPTFGICMAYTEPVYSYKLYNARSCKGKHYQNYGLGPTEVWWKDWMGDTKTKEAVNKSQDKVEKKPKEPDVEVNEHDAYVKLEEDTGLMEVTSGEGSPPLKRRFSA